MDLASEDDLDGDSKDGDIDHDEDQEDESALRAALNFYVGEICSGETGGKPMTGAAVSTLAEVVFKYAEALALDLRVFAKHGKRAVVGVDDVKCAARKDPKLVQMLTQFDAAHLGGGKKKPGRKRKASNGAAGGLTKPVGQAGCGEGDNAVDVLDDKVEIKAGLMEKKRDSASSDEADEFDELLL